MRTTHLRRGRAALLILLIAILIAVVIIICRPPESEPLPVPDSADIVLIPVLMKNGQIEELPLGEFLVGVVAAEMPASFAAEALKAQTVAARTYIARRLLLGGKHEDAVVCCDHTCCQAYCSLTDMQAKWGENYQHNLDKITQAVNDTAGLVLYWQGSLAETPYFSTCGGNTEDAAACWGHSYGYLQPVACPFCQHSPRFTGTVSLSLAEAAEKLGSTAEQLHSMRTVHSTPGNRVAELELGASKLAGTEVRTALGLNSAAFTWLILGDNISFFTLGFGHGVGLCQYGADGMAQAGYDYQQILTHYYTGTSVEPLVL